MAFTDGITDGMYPSVIPIVKVTSLYGYLGLNYLYFINFVLAGLDFNLTHMIHFII